MTREFLLGENKSLALEAIYSLFLRYWRQLHHAARPMLFALRLPGLAFVKYVVTCDVFKSALMCWKSK